MKLCSIASGSSGNCVYAGSKETHILVDAGISGKRIEEGLAGLFVSPDKLSGIFITHEHSDHIQGLGVMARKYHIPVYATAETMYAMIKNGGIGRLAEDQMKYVKPDESLNVGDILIHPFSMSHDASNPVCYTLEAEGHKVGIATDLGVYNNYTLEQLTGSEILYIEANYDVNMLMVGKYPYYLKQRILGNKGHLSNENSAQLICELQHEGLKHVLLAHLSKENNYAELAYETVRVEVEKNWTAGVLPQITVANRDIPSEMIAL